MSYVLRKISRKFNALTFGLLQSRSVIIISEKKTKHLTFSSAAQLFAIVGLLAAGITGYVFMDELQDAPVVVAAAPTPATVETTTASFSVPASDATQLEDASPEEMQARISELESKVKELNYTNSSIIRTVQEKTRGKIVAMEEIIRATGLNVESLKAAASKELNKEKKSAATKPEPQEEESGDDENAQMTPSTILASGQGGPFIPAETPGFSVEAFGRDLDAKMRHIAVLNEIITSMPLGRPVNGGKMMSNFGRRIDPFNGRIAFHAGIDLSAPGGSSVRSTGEGYVVRAGWTGGYGYMVEVDHGYGITTRYAHLSRILVTEGQRLSRNQVLGVQGSTGRSTGPHVHYEVRVNNRPVNPINFVNVKYDVSQLIQQ